MDELPDGYRWTGRGMEIALIDPDWCPAGHPFIDGQRSSLAHCREHKPHLAWKCACGQRIYRHAGAFWGELECLS